MNEIIRAMEERRSIRKFKSIMPPKDDLEQIIEAGLYAANGICSKNQKHFNQFTMSLLFCVILFYMIFLPLYLPLSEFVNTGGTI